MMVSDCGTRRIPARKKAARFGARQPEQRRQRPQERPTLPGRRPQATHDGASEGRATGDERNRLPRLHRLRDSGSIEQDADTVVFVWRKYDDEQGRLTDEGAFVVAKSRMGTTGAARFVFDGQRQTFKLMGGVL